MHLKDKITNEKQPLLVLEERIAIVRHLLDQALALSSDADIKMNLDQLQEGALAQVPERRDDRSAKRLRNGIRTLVQLLKRKSDEVSLFRSMNATDQLSFVPLFVGQTTPFTRGDIIAVKYPNPFSIVLTITDAAYEEKVNDGMGARAPNSAFCIVRHSTNGDHILAEQHELAHVLMDAVVPHWNSAEKFETLIAATISVSQLSKETGEAAWPITLEKTLDILKNEMIANVSAFEQTILTTHNLDGKDILELDPADDATTGAARLDSDFKRHTAVIFTAGHDARAIAKKVEDETNQNTDRPEVSTQLATFDIAFKKEVVAMVDGISKAITIISSQATPEARKDAFDELIIFLALVDANQFKHASGYLHHWLRKKSYH